MFITDENRGRTVSGGHGIIAQKSISEIVTLHKKLMYYNKTSEVLVIPYIFDIMS